MSGITFVGAEPHELESRMLPVAHAEGGIVAMTLTVGVPGHPEQHVQIRVNMRAAHAIQLQTQLVSAIAMATLR